MCFGAFAFDLIGGIEVFFSGLRSGLEDPAFIGLPGFSEFGSLF